MEQGTDLFAGTLPLVLTIIFCPIAVFAGLVIPVVLLLRTRFFPGRPSQDLYNDAHHLILLRKRRLEELERSRRRR